MTEVRCSDCSARLPTDAPEGFCPACALKMGLMGELTSPSSRAPWGDASGFSHSAVESSWISKAGPAQKNESGGHVHYFGDYELQEEIARGGMGVVYRARQLSLNRPVAVKMILSSRLSSPAAVQRFQREAEAAACLDHPHIVPIYEVGEHQGQHYYSMKLIEGEHLGKRVPDLARNPKEGVRLMATIAHAVHAAHDRGVLHRDLKPNNILLNAEGLPHVADFGLAKRIEEADGLTQSGMVMGAPNYMSPEQASGRIDAVTVVSDVFSLGVILYEVLTANLPFQAKSGEETLKKVIEEAPERPRIINDRLDRDLETICLKCLEKDPHHRYASAVALAEDLERWLRGEPITARPISRSHRAWRWSKRNPILAALGTSAIALLALVAGVSSYSIIDIQEEQRRRIEAQGDSLLEVNAAAVPAILDGLAEFPDWANPLLRELTGRNLPAEQLWRVRLGLLPSDPQQKLPLFDYMLEAKPDALLVIGNALADQEVPLAPLWKLVQDETVSPERRLRAASALALYDPQNNRWKEIAGDVANQLVHEEPAVLRDWKHGFEPVGNHLFAPLLAIYHDSNRSRTERSSAANILVDFGDEQPNWIVDLLKEAEGEFYSVFLAKLRSFPEEQKTQVVDMMRRTFAQEPEQGWREARPDPDWSTPDSGVVQTIKDALGMLTESFALCQAMPHEQFLIVSEELRQSGYRPAQLRPYTIQNDVLVAAIWTRDGRDWKAIHDATPEELRQRHEQLHSEGWMPADVSPYLTFDNGGPIVRYAALWSSRGVPEEEACLFVDMSARDFNDVRVGLAPLNYSLTNYRVAIGDDGKERYSSIWREHYPNRISRSFRDINSPEFREPSDVPMVAIDLSATTHFDLGSTFPTARDPQQLLAEADRVLSQKADDLDGRRQRAMANWRLGRDADAVADFSFLIENSSETDPNNYWYRAVAYAREGDTEKAKQDLYTFSLRTLMDEESLSTKAALAAAVSAILEDEAEAFDRLEEFVAEQESDNGCYYDAACAYAIVAGFMGEDDSPNFQPYAERAVELLREAIPPEPENYRALLFDPKLETIRNYPGFMERVRQVHQRAYQRFAGVRQMGTSVESEKIYPVSLERHLQRCQQLSSEEFRPVSISVSRIQPAPGQAEGEAGIATAASLWHRSVPSQHEIDDLAKQQANIAVALLTLGRAEEIWPLLRHSRDPRLRTYLIHRFAALEADPQLLIDRLEEESDASVRRALMLSLGEYGPRALPHGIRMQLVPRFLQTYRKDPDPGIHSAMEWLLRRWGHSRQLKLLDEQWTGQEASDGRRWYINSQQHKMAILTPGGLDGRTFAIATKEVTTSQFKPFLRNQDSIGWLKTLDSGHPEAPMRPLIWYDAIKYCRWLSEQENIPEHEMCYPPMEEIGEEMTLPEDLLQRTGYRLPTPEEWDYAARAETRTSRYYGHDDKMLPHYAWSFGNSDGWNKPVGRLKPNGLGLFDVLGNVSEFSHTSGSNAVVLGGNFMTSDADTRVFPEGTLEKTVRASEIGLRVARTMPRSDADTEE